MSEHLFPYKWTLKDTVFTKNKGTVFSCFACGGGSTMGYKLAGFDVLGCNEIDPKMMAAYIENHKPKYSYLEPIQTFKNRTDLSKELYNLDILDGSPPCSNFSMAGNREKDWGKEKKFREGQAKQVLDTLFFDFIDLAKKLQPRIVIAENVMGILIGNAREYVRKIYDDFDNAGYYLQHFELDASKMGVPQKRKRVFFIGLRKDFESKVESTNSFMYQPILNMDFNEKEIPFKDIENFCELSTNKVHAGMLDSFYRCQPGDNMSTVSPKGKNYWFNYIKIHPNKPLPTLASASRDKIWHYEKPYCLGDGHWINGSSFPTDYNYVDNDIKYICGMSVPPVMIAQIAKRIYDQWLVKINN